AVDRLAVELEVLAAAVARIGEEDASARVHVEVVRAVEPAALVAVGQGGDAAVLLHARQAPATLSGGRAALADDQAVRAVECLAVGSVGLLAEGRDAAVGAEL